MKTLEEIREAKASGNYYAVSRRGKKYEAAYTTEYGGVMFFCIPREEEIIGYEERGGKMETITQFKKKTNKAHRARAA